MYMYPKLRSYGRFIAMNVLLILSKPFVMNGGSVMRNSVVSTSGAK